MWNQWVQLIRHKQHYTKGIPKLILYAVFFSLSFFFRWFFFLHLRSDVPRVETCHSFLYLYTILLYLHIIFSLGFPMLLLVLWTRRRYRNVCICVYLGRRMRARKVLSLFCVKRWLQSSGWQGFTTTEMYILQPMPHYCVSLSTLSLAFVIMRKTWKHTCWVICIDSMTDLVAGLETD